MNFSGKDINRLMKHPRGQMAMAMGDVGAMERIVRQGRERDRDDEYRRYFGSPSMASAVPVTDIKPRDVVSVSPNEIRNVTDVRDCGQYIMVYFRVQPPVRLNKQQTMLRSHRH